MFMMLQLFSRNQKIPGVRIGWNGQIGLLWHFALIARPLLNKGFQILFTFGIMCTPHGIILPCNFLGPKSQRFPRFSVFHHKRYISYVILQKIEFLKMFASDWIEIFSVKSSVLSIILHIWIKHIIFIGL